MPYCIGRRCGLLGSLALGSLALISLLLAPGIARGSAYDLYGFGPRAMAMGGAATAYVTDYAAVFYNPAALTELPSAQLGFSYQMALSTLKIERSKADSEIANVYPPQYFGLSIGVTVPFGGVFKKRLAFGMSIHIPSTSLFRIDAQDPRTPYFYLYQSYPNKCLVNLETGVKVTDFLSLGVGLHMLALINGTSELGADFINGRWESRKLFIDFFPTGAVNAGLLLKLMQNKTRGTLKFGVAYRGALELSYNLTTRLSLEGFADLNLRINGVAVYTPHRLSFGLAYWTPDRRLGLSFDLTVEFWAGAPDPSTMIPLDVSGEALDAMGLGEVFDLPQRRIPLGAQNIAIPRIGMEYRLSRHFTLRGGYFFRPTPIPRQVGFTNYVDNSAHVISMGLAITYRDPLKVAKQPLTLEFSFQATLLPRRRVEKVDGQDPVGDYVSRGAIFNLTIALRHDF